MAMALTSYCASLAKCFEFEVVLPKTGLYNTILGSYYSAQEASLTPACIVLPESAQDVREIVSRLVEDNQSDFAIRGGGHAAASGFANINAGITIDLDRLNHVTTNSEGTIAMVGSGATWVDVYSHLEPIGRTVAGGRNGNVGVGGLTLGGGISYFSPQVGFTCDTVINFEVVLASGQLVNANSTSHADLFRALKGGSNNFGVVTRFDYTTIPFDGHLLGGTVIYNISQHEAVFDALVKIAGAPDYDPHASIVAGYGFNSGTQAWSLFSTPIYTKVATRPQVYEELFNIPNITSSVKLQKLASFANETAPPQKNQLFLTGTYGVDFKLLKQIFKLSARAWSEFDSAHPVSWSIAFEPLPVSFLQAGAGRNSLGTYPTSGNGFIMLLSPGWIDSALSDRVHAKSLELLNEINDAARNLGLLHDFVYANYADGSQNPLASYSSTNYDFLEKVAHKYDHHQVFQHQVPGGFKLITSSRNWGKFGKDI